jgi:hypothetical protein
MGEVYHHMRGVPSCSSHMRSLHVPCSVSATVMLTVGELRWAIDWCIGFLFEPVRAEIERYDMLNMNPSHRCRAQLSPGSPATPKNTRTDLVPGGKVVVSCLEEASRRTEEEREEGVRWRALPVRESLCNWGNRGTALKEDLDIAAGVTDACLQTKPLDQQQSEQVRLRQVSLQMKAWMLQFANELTEVGQWQLERASERGEERSDVENPGSQG